uniref:type III-A CRISPR-associated protein Csm2 n=1 Tax=Dialister sp. TaxID=1955814 RepID=UPI0040254810
MDNNYVDQAQMVMENLSHDKNMVTTSQIRKFLTAVNTVSGKVDQFRNSGKGDTLPEDLQMQVKFLKVKLAYQIGRDKSKGGTNVEKFSKNAGLMNKIDNIGSSMEKYESFARYVEALVAFHKFYGGADN